METSAFECAARDQNVRPTTLLSPYISEYSTIQYLAAVASRSCSLGAGWLAYCANKVRRGKVRCGIDSVKIDQ